ncbi:MAG: hypothetical protein CML31_05040 [Rhizobiales bacterium]|nr:hypothetical protein [Hoeflea sp.]MBG19317.1 hypothetical protein [Hyphomicrobiales bacterium]|tara:strand:- start:162 stop:365 length:204 start_codon:yes stop_codon:yes gene_type:complete
MTTRTLATTVLFMLLASLTLTACGRQGEPLRPSVARAEAAKQAGVKDSTDQDIEVEDRRFVLDPLLD